MKYFLSLLIDEDYNKINKEIPKAYYELRHRASPGDIQWIGQLLEQSPWKYIEIFYLYYGRKLLLEYRYTEYLSAWILSRKAELYHYDIDGAIQCLFTSCDQEKYFIGILQIRTFLRDVLKYNRRALNNLSLLVNKSPRLVSKIQRWLDLMCTDYYKVEINRDSFKGDRNSVFDNACLILKII